ncbi:hypothetical protein GGQ22_04600 [Nocardioides sp. zg-579]|uniref:DUF1345 domain-containing protein n=2 Tax=Nocardioides marmotae TaxID=2663857 RepID=A0A6I3JAG6_9ACTN|nr:hypothetical protein [Gordonia jinghuaiqii]MTB94355.1 hypothetical protein [Nocardioides marmotae]QKE01618.1 hypothetical protein HPC71_11395 [Nocardioides marmotae]
MRRRAGSGSGSRSTDPYGETRWPMAAAVAVAMGLTAQLPDDLRLAEPWVLPSTAGLLLVVLIAGDPGRISRRTTILRASSIALIAVLALASSWSMVRLVHDIVTNGPETDSASELLRAGGCVWLGSVIACALLYFELDCGGAAARAERMPRTPDLAFPQQLTPEVSPEGWRPRFVDYLYLGLTNATAFSPTDVMPLVPWAKAVMSIQAVTSLGVMALVVARAVNVLQ